MARRRRRGTGGAVKRHRGRRTVWCARWRWQGRIIERVAGEYRSDATDLLAQVKQLVQERRLELPVAVRAARGEAEADVPKFGRVLDLFLESPDFRMGKHGERKPQNLKNAKYQAGNIDRPLRDLLVRDVDVAAVALWHERLARGGRKGRTLNRYLSLGSRVWQYAQNHGYVDSEARNPFRRIKRADEPTLDKDVLTIGEVATVVRVAREDLKPVLIAGIATGARCNELLSLTWGDLDLKERYLVIRPENEKAGCGRRVPMTTELCELLAELRKRAPLGLKTHAANPDAPVFLTARGKPHTYTSVRHRVLEVRERLLKVKDFPERKARPFTFKNLRDATVCNLLALNKPTATVAKIVGHRHLATTEKYLGLLVDQQREAIEAYSAVRFSEPALVARGGS